MAKKVDFNELLNAIENNSSSSTEISVLQNYVSEYLKTYILLGYDNSGERIVLINGKTEQDYDSLERLIRRFSDIQFFTEDKQTEELENEN